LICEFLDHPSGSHSASPKAFCVPSCLLFRMFVHDGPSEVVPGVRTIDSRCSFDERNKPETWGDQGYGRDHLFRSDHGVHIAPPGFSRSFRTLIVTPASWLCPTMSGDMQNWRPLLSSAANKLNSFKGYIASKDPRPLSQAPSYQRVTTLRTPELIPDPRPSNPGHNGQAIN